MRYGRLLLLDIEGWTCFLRMMSARSDDLHLELKYRSQANRRFRLRNASRDRSSPVVAHGPEPDAPQSMKLPCRTTNDQPSGVI